MRTLLFYLPYGIPLELFRTLHEQRRCHHSTGTKPPLFNGGASEPHPAEGNGCLPINFSCVGISKFLLLPSGRR